MYLFSRINHLRIHSEQNFILSLVHRLLKLTVKNLSRHSIDKRFANEYKRRKKISSIYINSNKSNK